MASIPASTLLPEELAGLGLTGASGSVEVPNLVSPATQKPIVGTLDPAHVPEPSPGVIAAARAIESGAAATPKISPEDQEEQMAFLVHLLGGKPFRKVSRYFGGQIQVTIRSRTALEDDLCARETAKLPSNLPPVEYVRLYEEFAQLLSLEELRLGDQPPQRFDFASAPSLMVARDALFAQLPGPIVNLIRTSYAEFDMAYQGLMSRRNEPDFQKAGSPK